VAVITSPVNTTSDLETQTPPIVPGTTQMSQEKWMGVMGDEEDNSPIAMISEAGELFARIAQVDPTVLRTVLEMGMAIERAAVQSSLTDLTAGGLQSSAQLPPQMPTPVESPVRPPAPLM
jgi:hypothetical protein